MAATCSERGELLDRIWKATSSLLDVVAEEMGGTVEKCERRMADLNLRANKHEGVVGRMRRDHGEELRRLTQSVGHKWGKRVEALKVALMEKESEARVHGGTVELLRVWFPRFENYSGTVMRELVGKKDKRKGEGGGEKGEREEGDEGAGEGEGVEDEKDAEDEEDPEDVSEEEEDAEDGVDLMMLLPEEALAADLQRVVSSCLMDSRLVLPASSSSSLSPSSVPLPAAAALTARLASMLVSPEDPFARAESGSGTESGRERVTNGDGRNEIVFRTLMSASRE